MRGVASIRISVAWAFQMQRSCAQARYSRLQADFKRTVGTIDLLRVKSNLKRDDDGAPNSILRQVCNQNERRTPDSPPRLPAGAGARRFPFPVSH